jgi:hypothetical protein
MRALSSSDVLDLWQRGSRLHSLDQGLMVLGAALPETPYANLADWPLGRRNSALAELRCLLFGPNLQGWVSCSACGEKLEFQMDGRVLTSTKEPGLNEQIVIHGLSFRLPGSRDLAWASNETDPRLAAIRLVENCRLETGDSPEWSEQDLEEMGEKMAFADPMAETRLTFQCPECSNEWDETLDISTFLWAEIDAQAKRLLLEIHSLASAYGWTEMEILSLSDHRRALYLEMVRQ